VVVVVVVVVVSGVVAGFFPPPQLAKAPSKTHEMIRFIGRCSMTLASMSSEALSRS
jgi:NhaP-type Na+/H+ or K+/H+ antiporter